MAEACCLIGLLAGRELALCKRGISGLTLQDTGPQAFERKFRCSHSTRFDFGVAQFRSAATHIHI